MEDEATAPDKKNLRARCNHCGMMIKCKKASPTGMKQHLQRKHHDLYQKFKNKELENVQKR